MTQQLDPLSIAERDIRFLEVNQDELKADIEELVDLIRAEADDEQHLNSAISSLIYQLQKLSTDLPDLNKDGVERVKNEALPALQKQLDDITARHYVIEEHCKTVDRRWPDDSKTISAAQDIIDRINSSITGQQERFDSAANQQKAIEDWLARKDELKHQLLRLPLDELATVDVGPRTYGQFQNESREIWTLTDKLRRLKEMLQGAIDWLLSNKNLPIPVRDVILTQLRGEISEIEDEENKLKNLLNNIPNISDKLQELEDRRDYLAEKLELLRQKAVRLEREATEKQARQEKTSEEWLSKQEDLEQQLMGVQSDLTVILERNADNLEQPSTRDIEEDIQQSSNMIDRVKQLKDLLQKTFNWLQSNEDLPDDSKVEAIQRIQSMMSCIDDEEAKLDELSSRLPLILKQLEDRSAQDLRNQIDFIIQQQHDQLKELIEGGRRILSELPDSIDQIDEYNDRHANSIKSTQQLLQDSSSQGTHIEALNQLLDAAKEVKRSIDAQLDRWLEFKKLRDGITEKQEKIEGAIETVGIKWSMPPEEARNTLKSLEVRGRIL